VGVGPLGQRRVNPGSSRWGAEMGVSEAGSSVPVVLLVDDDARLLQALREVARSRSYQILTTTSPQEALKVLRTRPVAIVVADAVMPEMSGLELLGIVAKDFPEVGRIVLTGNATVELATRAINQAQVHSFLQKPCKAAALRGAIKALLKAPRPAAVAGQHRLDDEQIPVAKADQPTDQVASDRDPATGLYTRQALERLFREQPSGSAAGPCSVIYADIDRLHLINDAHGFAYGDEIIKSLAGLLGSPLLPKSALAARASGGCFLIALPGCEQPVAKMIASRVKDTAAKVIGGTLRASGKASEISVSCGVAVVHDTADAFSKAIAAAEIACRAAKDHGRNRVELDDANDASLMRRHGDVRAVGVLRAALKNNQFQLYAQKIVSLRDPERPCSYEVLTRLRTPDGGIASLGQYIGTAQRYQLLTKIDRWIAEHALAMLAPHAMRLHRLDITVSLNVTGQSIGDPDFMRFLTTQLKRSGIPGRNLMLELTEQAAVVNLKRAGELLKEFCRTGCRIALDDFGTGSNSLASFKGLPLGRVKIDGSFVLDVQTSRRSQATVTAIVQLAKSIGADTVGEFVETSEIANKLRELGVDYAQGYAFGKPEPLEGVLDQLMKVEEPRIELQF
jgi:diguanylate cyclase (GGDEF)-like protein